jgi:murein DD-endopeptidase MepM/ murein hydrolase activator NlpD
MRYKATLKICMILLSAAACFAENIDPDNSGRQYAYGENIGWLNFEPNVPEPNAGATVSRTKLTGYIWAENIGWINLSPASYGGVLNDGYGNLSGYAWGENVGWINFDPQSSGTHYGVRIDAGGSFSGYAWGENIGWINFNNASLYGNGVKVCVVDYFDLKTFTEQWLFTGPGHSADLHPDNNIDFEDFAILADYWLDYCPDNWSL